MRQKYGVEANHAYSLMKCFEEKLDNGQAIRLVQIRNPWGFGEWNGDWADYSKGKLPDCWEKNPELKKRLKVRCFVFFWWCYWLEMKARLFADPVDPFQF